MIAIVERGRVVGTVPGHLERWLRTLNAGRFPPGRDAHIHAAAPWEVDALLCGLPLPRIVPLLPNDGGARGL